MIDALPILLGAASFWAAVSTWLVWRGKVRIRELAAEDKRHSREHAADLHREDSQQIVTIEAFRAIREENESIRDENGRLRAENLVLRERIKRLKSDPPPAGEVRDTLPERNR